MKKVKKQPVEAIWEGLPCAVLASGPSLGFDDYADVKLIKESGIKTIAVNSTWEHARFCDVIYGGDGVWWKYHHSSIDIPAERWTCSKGPVQLYNCRYRARHVKPGYNSGCNAVELAANVFKASPVIMLGFDCSIKHGVHHHGKHKQTSNPTSDRTERWKPQFKSLRDKTKGATIYNCSRYSELGYFPRRDLKDVLCELGLISDTH